MSETNPPETSESASLPPTPEIPAPEPALTGKAATAGSNMERILDIELPVSVSFGAARRPLSEIVKLIPGTILELDTASDDLAVLKVNNRTFAHGEIVEVEGYYGIRITEIDSTSERLARLEQEAQ